MSRIHRRSTILVWLAILIVANFIISNIILERKSIMEMKRDQARYLLKQVKYCYTNVLELTSLDRTLSICTDKSRTSYTGDVYVLNSETLEFIHETSRDIPRNKKVYFTKDSVGKEFRDWESAKKALDLMLLGKDSEPGVNASYQFDDDVEWIEWIYLPDDSSITNRMIVVQGIQRDEVLTYLIPFKVATISSTVIIVVLLLAIHKRRRDDDG